MSAPDPDDVDALIERIACTTDAEEKRRLYGRWADRYDDDLDDLGYVAPGVAVDLLERHAQAPTGRVYDAGCGTGRVGRVLARRGWREVVGGDFSAAMRELAHDSGVYAELRHDDYNGTVGLADASFDVVVGVGVYGEGFRDRFLDEMLRILVPAGLFVFSVRPVYWEREVEDDIESLVRVHAVDVLSVERKPYMLERKTTAWYACLRKRG